MNAMKAGAAVIGAGAFLAYFGEQFVRLAVAYCQRPDIPGIPFWYAGVFAILMLPCCLFPAAMMLTGLSPLLAKAWGPGWFIRDKGTCWRMEMRVGPMFLLPVATLWVVPAAAVAVAVCYWSHEVMLRIGAVVVLPVVLCAVGMWMARRTGMVWVEIDKETHELRALQAANTTEVQEMGVAKTCGVVPTNEEIAQRGGGGQRAVWLVLNTAKGPMPVASSALTKWPSLTEMQVEGLMGTVKEVMGIGARSENRKKRGR